MKGIVENLTWYKVYYKDYPFWFRWHQIRDDNSWQDWYFHAVDIAIDAKRFWWTSKKIIFEDVRVKIGGKKKTAFKEGVDFSSIEGLEDILERAYTKSVTKSQPTYAVKCSPELESTL